MFNFCHIDLELKNGQSMDNGWWLLVENEWELLEWFARANNFAKVWYDLKTSPKEHFKSMEAYFLDFQCSINKDNKTSFSNLDLATMFNEMKYGTKAKMLAKHGSLLINRVGGFCILDSKFITVKARVQNENLVWPDTKTKEIKITQFPGGTHYYASINSVAIEVNGVGKWDTREEATAAVDEYLNKNKLLTAEESFND